MATQNVVKNNFTAGEISPTTEGRTDFDKYKNACHALENFTVVSQGGARRRYGTEFICPVYDHAHPPILVPFEYDADTVYMLEINSAGRCRVFKDGAPLLKTVLYISTYWSQSGFSTFTAANVNNGNLADTALDTTGAANDSYLKFNVGVSPSFGYYAGVTITTAGNDTQTYVVEWSDDDVTYFIAATLTNGTNLLSATWRLGDRHRYWRIRQTATGTGRVWNEVQFTEPVLVSIPYATNIALDSLRFAQSADTLYAVTPELPPFVIRRASEAKWIASTASFAVFPSAELGDYMATTITPGATTGTGVTFTLGAANALVGDVGREIISGVSRATITAAPTTSTYTADITVAFDSTAAIASGSWYLSGSPQVSMTPSVKETIGTPVGLTASANAWRTADVGKYVVINGGVIECTQWISATVMNGVIRSLLTSVALSPAGSWSLELKAFSSASAYQFGYPSAIVFHEQRLLLAQRVRGQLFLWGSKTGDYGNFATGTLDDDGLSYPLTETNAARWLSVSQRLFVGTTAGEIVLRGGTLDDPLTPISVQAKHQTNYGSADLAAVPTDTALLFVPRSRTRLHELAYSFETDSYVAPDLTLLADHVTQHLPVTTDYTTAPVGITSIAYQTTPTKTIWATRADGVLLGLTYLREQNVVAWHRHVTDGLILRVAVLPYQSQVGGTWRPVHDEIWVIVRRTIDGSNKYFIERMNPYALVADYTTTRWYGVYLDCAVPFNNGSPSTTVSGLLHLKGKLVTVLANSGTSLQTATVSSTGTVTLSATVTSGFVGLPFTSTLTPVRPEMQTGSGSIQAHAKRFAQLTARLVETLGGKVNGEATGLGTVGPLKTQDAAVNNLGWDDDGYVTIVQDQPYPMTVAALIGELELGE